MALEGSIEPGHTWSPGDDVDADTLNQFLELARVLIPSPIGLKDGGTGGDTVVSGQKELQVVGRLQAWVEFGDSGTGITLGTLPADSFYEVTFEHVTEAFDGTGTDLLEVGTDADNDFIATSQDVSSTGVLTPTVGVGHGYNSSSQTIKAFYVDSNADATAGKVLVVVIFTQVDTQP